MTTGSYPVRRWPLFLIAAPAAVAIWSGWVGLGGMCGFGVVHPLPGIVPGLQIDTAITLPVGVEAYGAYALGAWLGLAEDHPARAFARRSAIGALALGMLGQVCYHLLAAAHAARAPWPVVVAVSCMPVITLGFGAALTHLLRAVPEAGVPVSGPVTGAGTAGNGLPAHLIEAQQRYAADLAEGVTPAIRRIRSDLGIGQTKATEVQAHLSALTRT
ncbi:MAG: hypothetical protein ACLP52_08590 [Streptosporangiaceae bacterium]